MEKIYYSPNGFWKGETAIQKLAKEAKVSKKQAFEFLKKQAVWQIYLIWPTMRRVLARDKAFKQLPGVAPQGAMARKAQRILDSLPEEAEK